MRLVSARDLGLYVRQRRQDLGRSQADLASMAGVSRRWLTAMEAGKSTAEIGLILRTLAALGVIIDVQVIERPPGQVDLDELLAELGRDDG